MALQPSPHLLSASHPPRKIPLILDGGSEQKLWAKRLIPALIRLVSTIIKVLNWFLGGYAFFIAGPLPGLSWTRCLFRWELMETFNHEADPASEAAARVDFRPLFWTLS